MDGDDRLDVQPQALHVPVEGAGAGVRRVENFRCIEHQPVAPIRNAAGHPDTLDGYDRGRYGSTLMVTISFKVSDDEARSIRERARQEGVSVSEYLRRRARLTTAGSTTWPRVRCPHTGAVIFAEPDGEPPLATDAVRELLADFP